MSSLITEIAAQFEAGYDLDAADAETLLDEMISETDQELLTRLFVVWNRKGIASNEIYSIANVLRSRCVAVNSPYETFVDIVGTGGSTAKTFNVSTAAAFVVAGTGLPVAKHGNRAATSNSGSADVLSELGVKPDILPELAERCLNEIGICFMFAPNHHRLSPTLAAARRGLGFPTIFNCVGPLCNPANVPHQVIGVWSRDMVPKMSSALSSLGTKRSWIVNGHDKLDEISVTGHTTVGDVRRSSISTYDVAANDLGFETFAGDLPANCTQTESAGIIRSILEGKMIGTGPEKLVLLNSAAAIFVAGRSEDLRSAYKEAAGAIRTGAALKKLGQLSQMTSQ